MRGSDETPDRQVASIDQTLRTMWSPLGTSLGLSPPPALVPRLAGGLLEGVAAVGQAVGGDLPEEDAAEPLAHRPLGLQRDRLGVVVADHGRAVGRQQPGVLGLVVPAPRPALLVLEPVEVAV